MQFIQKRHGQVGLQHVQATDIGLKDSHRSLFSIWQEIFQLPKPKRRRFADIADIENHKSLADNRGMPLGEFQGNMSSVGEQRGMTSLASRFHTVLHSAMSNGQYDKLTQGKLLLYTFYQQGWPKGGLEYKSSPATPSQFQSDIK